MGEMFHAEKFKFGVSNDSREAISAHQMEHKKSLGKKRDDHGVEGFFHTKDVPGPAMSRHHHQQQYFEFGNLDNPYIDATPLFQSCKDEITKVSIESQSTELTEPTKRQSSVFSDESSEVLRKYRSRRLKLGGNLLSTCYEVRSTHAGGTTVTTEAVIEMAAEKFIQSMSQSSIIPSSLNHPYPGSISDNSEADSNEVQLVQNLLFCAEKVAESEYEYAILFLKECDKMSSRTGTPVQRLAFYFSEALFHKISVGTGTIIPKDPEMKPEDPLDSVYFTNPTLQIAFYKGYPLPQIVKIVGIQAILDHLEEARKVHMIDLEIRSGVHWIALMQALAARSEHPVEHLKITAVGTKWRPMMEETGRQLESFAQSLNLKFTFKIVFVEDMLDLNQHLFDLDADESVAVYASYILMAMIGRIDWLNHLMGVMRNISPCVMIVSDIEANCNSPTFIGRFVESLFFFGAFFDSLADCFKKDNTCRENIESSWFRSSIRNILSAEGKQRKIRHVDISVWRAFFVRFGLVEIELSTSCLDQATLGLQSLPCGSSWTLYADGKCLTLGWKGTPISTISAWKFHHPLFLHQLDSSHLIELNLEK